jgi:excisionase family DNA binding protein
MSKTSGVPTATELRSLPATVELWPTAAELLGVSRATAYRMAQDGSWPTKLLRLGRLYRVPTQGPDGLLAVLNLDAPDGGAAA